MKKNENVLMGLFLSVFIFFPTAVIAIEEDLWQTNDEGALINGETWFLPSGYTGEIPIGAAMVGVVQVLSEDGESTILSTETGAIFKSENGMFSFTGNVQIDGLDFEVGEKTTFLNKIPSENIDASYVALEGLQLEAKSKGAPMSLSGEKFSFNLNKEGLIKIEDTGEKMNVVRLENGKVSDGRETFLKKNSEMYISANKNDEEEPIPLEIEGFEPDDEGNEFAQVVACSGSINAAVVGISGYATKEVCTSGLKCKTGEVNTVTINDPDDKSMKSVEKMLNKFKDEIKQLPKGVKVTISVSEYQEGAGAKDGIFVFSPKIDYDKSPSLIDTDFRKFLKDLKPTSDTNPPKPQTTLECTGGGLIKDALCRRMGGT